MDHIHPLLAAMLVDREREIERNIRIRRLLDAADATEQSSTKPGPSTGFAPVRPIAPRPTGPGGPACEAL